MSIWVYTCSPGELGKLEEWPMEEEEDGMPAEPKSDLIQKFFSPLFFEALFLCRKADFLVSDADGEAQEFNFNATRMVQFLQAHLGGRGYHGFVNGKVLIAFRDETLVQVCRMYLDVLRDED